MALFSVELLIEIDAPSAEDAAELAMLDVRTTSDTLKIAVYSDETASGRCWQYVAVDVRMLEGTT